MPEYVAARFKGSERVNRWPCVGRVILGCSASKGLPFALDGTVEVLGTHRCGL